MTVFQIITTFFLWSLLFVSCNTTKDEKNIISSLAITNGQQHDTVIIYSTTTRALKNSKIPDSVFRIVRLEQLTVSGMDCDYGDNTACWMIREIPGEIRNLKYLKRLRLNLNAITTIPNELTELKYLELVDLTDNSALENIDNLTKIESLEYLYLYGCGLTKMPEKIGKLKNLKELGLAGNHISGDEKERIKRELPNCDIKF